MQYFFFNFIFTTYIFTESPIITCDFMDHTDHGYKQMPSFCVRGSCFRIVCPSHAHRIMCVYEATTQISSLSVTKILYSWKCVHIYHGPQEAFSKKPEYHTISSILMQGV